MQVALLLADTMEGASRNKSIRLILIVVVLCFVFVSGIRREAKNEKASLRVL